MAWFQDKHNSVIMKTLKWSQIENVSTHDIFSQIEYKYVEILKD